MSWNPPYIIPTLGQRCRRLLLFVALQASGASWHFLKMPEDLTEGCCVGECPAGSTVEGLGFQGLGSFVLVGHGLSGKCRTV